MTIAAQHRDKATRARIWAGRAVAWWLGELAALGRDAARLLHLGERGAVTICAGERYWALRHRQRPIGQVDWQLHDGESGRAALAGLIPNAVRGRQVLVEIPPERILSKIVAFPPGARPELGRILEFEIARHFPFPAARVFFRHRVLPRAGNAPLAVELVAVPRDTVAAIVAELTAAGLSVAGVAVVPPGDGEALLLPNEARGAAPPGARANARLGLVIAGLAAMAAASWPAAQHIRLGALDRDIAALKPQAEAALAARARGQRDSDRIAALVRLRAARPPLVEVLDRLSRAVPDGAWLLSLSVAGRDLVVDGLSPSAAATVLALQHGGAFADIQFRAPITRESGGLEHFQLGATIAGGEK